MMIQQTIMIWKRPKMMSTECMWKRSHLYFFLLLTGFSLLSILFMDRKLLLLFQQLPGYAAQTFEIITKAGVSTAYIVGSAVLFVLFQWILKKKHLANKALLVLLSVSVAGVLNAFFKFLFGRYRPKAFLEEGLYGFTFFKTDYIFTSFPSGHSNTAAALMVALCLLFPRCRLLFLGIALLIILSRLALCAHYLSDVLWGAYLGCMTTLWLSAQMEQRGLHHKPFSV